MTILIKRVHVTCPYCGEDQSEDAKDHQFMASCIKCAEEYVVYLRIVPKVHVAKIGRRGPEKESRALTEVER